MTTLILAAMAAALVGDFRSFPIATRGRVRASASARRWSAASATRRASAPSLPFLVIIVVLVFRGRSLPLRDHYLQQLPAVGNGRIIVGLDAVRLRSRSCSSCSPRTPKWMDAFTVSLGVAIVLLSIVVVTGYAGQLSLAQFAIAGFGAWVAGRLVAVSGMPFLLGAAGRRRRHGPARAGLRACPPCGRAASTWRSSRSGSARRSS